MALESGSSQDTPVHPVLDASALLALLHNERGADVVAEAVAGRAVISIVNLAEVLSKFAERGSAPDQVMALLQAEGGIGGAITVEPFTEADAIEVARLRPVSKTAGLSLGDRACLALAKRLHQPALTAEHGWLTIQTEVGVRVIRERRS
ncbi:MAG: type II toxin-antitoxin system VapC family toxin [Solirubrobacteraceae bacterium]